MRAIILAAGMGRRLRSFSSGPKCLIKINEDPLLIRSIKLLRKNNIKDITVVIGYKSGEVVNAVKKSHLRVKFKKNNDFSQGSILSLWHAREELQKEILIMDADLYFEESLLVRVAASPRSNFFLIDSTARKDGEAVIVGFINNRAVALQRGLKGAYQVCGEWAGFLKLSGCAVDRLKKLLIKKVSSGERNIGYEFIIPELFSKVRISYELIDGLKWTEIDFPKDIKMAKSLRLPGEY